ncbi:unnamed protein product [Ectocarpus sp. 12 AP-2014]
MHEYKTIFGDLLLPPPYHEEGDPDKATQARTFVVNRRAGHALCSLLEASTFMALPGDIQRQVMVLLEAGLSSGHCSVVRLRLSCEGGQLVRRVLGLLRGLSATSAHPEDIQTAAGEQQDQTSVIEVLGRVLGMVCSAGIGVNELKSLLHELRVPSVLTPPILDALSAMTSCESPSRRNLGGGKQKPKGVDCAAISSMFTFGGDGAGLLLPAAAWPFTHEYQFAAWIRVEQSAGLEPPPTQGGGTRKAHLVTFTTDAGAGMDYYIQVRFDRQQH